jgi:hypothetical protein
MTFKSIRDEVLVGFNDPKLYSDAVMSNATFNAIRDMQESTNCSVTDFDLDYTGATEAVTKVNLSDLVYKLESGDYGWVDDVNLVAKAHCLFIESVFDVTEGDPGERIYGTNKLIKDSGLANDELLAADFNKSSMTLYAPGDWMGRIIRVRCRFMLDYVEGEFAEENETTEIYKCDLFLSSIPVQFRRYLVEGIQYHLFKYFYRMTGRKDLLEISERSRKEWLGSSVEGITGRLPFVKQQVQKILLSDVIYKPVPQTITTIRRDSRIRKA